MRVDDERFVLEQENMLTVIMHIELEFVCVTQITQLFL